MNLAYPDAEFVASLRNEGVLDLLIEILNDLHPDLAPRVEHLSKFIDAQFLGELSGEYMRLFETVGGRKSAASLYGGHYSTGDRVKVMEEGLRFYNHFGLVLDQTCGEMPDYLPTQLEFLHFLAYRQAALQNEEIDVIPLIRGEVDFIERCILPWMPTLAERLKTKGEPPPEFYYSLVSLSVAFLEGVSVALRGCLSQNNIVS